MKKIDEVDYKFVNYLDSAILEQSPFRLKIVLYIWLIAFVVFVIWANLTKIDEIVRGNGELIPSGENKVIQNLEGGIVEEIVVKEGQSIKKGDILLKIDNKKSFSNYETNQAEKNGLKMKILRLKAQTKLAKFKVEQNFKDTNFDIYKDQKRLYDDKINHLNSQIEIFQEQLIQKKSQLNEAKKTKIVLKNSLNLINEEIDMTKPLVKQGVKSKVEFLKLKREKNSILQKYTTLENTIPRLRSSIKEIENKKIEVQNKFISSSQEELNKANAMLLKINSQSKALQDQVKRTTVISPVNGIVQKLFIHTIGGVIKPGENLVEIVPIDASLLIETKVKPSDIAFIYPKQKAKIKILAYDFSIYGGFEGEVVNVSPDTVTNKRGDTFYLVYVKIDKKSLEHKKRPINLIPGMTVNVDIITGKKSLMDYILKPILKTKQYMFSER